MCDKTCCVCLDAIDAPLILRCGHFFHKDCIVEWEKSNNTCPMCRTHISVEYDCIEYTIYGDLNLFEKLNHINFKLFSYTPDWSKTSTLQMFINGYYELYKHKNPKHNSSSQLVCDIAIEKSQTHLLCASNFVWEKRNDIMTIKTVDIDISTLHI